MTFSAYINHGVHVGSGFRMSRATIIGPYPTADFIEEVLDWQPEEVILGVDDGWPQERIDDIRRVFAVHKAELILRRVAPSVGDGLVHAKLYCFEWINAANNRRRHTLLAGSANASLQGFSTHAEAFVHVDLANIAPSDKKEVLRYFGELALGHDVEFTQFYIADKSWLSMPALRVVHTPWPNGFDAWIRRGRLCHSYQPDPTFGRLVLRLKEPMPQDLLGTNLGNSGFSVAGETQAFTRPYVSYARDVVEEENERQNWRQRYFTETVYGYWTSAECFKRFEDEFVAPHAEGRELALDAIRYPEPTTRFGWIDDFMRSIDNVSETLRPSSGTPISKCFRRASWMPKNTGIRPRSSWTATGPRQRTIISANVSHPALHSHPSRHSAANSKSLRWSWPPTCWQSCSRGGSTTSWRSPCANSRLPSRT